MLFVAVHESGCWPDSEVAESLDDFRYRGYCGLVVLTVRLSESGRVEMWRGGFR